MDHKDKDGIWVQPNLFIPETELIIATSRSGGAGGQHVNKTDTQVQLKWHVATSNAITQEQKERLLNKLKTRLTDDGFIMVKSSASRSQLQNKKSACKQLAEIVKQALIIPKKRVKTKISQATREKRLHAKKIRGEIKRLRREFD